MNTIPLELSDKIIEFLPVATQLNVNKNSRSNTKSNKKIKKSIYKIASAAKNHRTRILTSVFLDEYTDNIQRAALTLYLSDESIDRLLNHIIKRGEPSYRQDVWTMCVDDRNCTPYPEISKDIVMLGAMLDWSPKKTFRQAIKNLDRLDLTSLMLTLN